MPVSRHAWPPAILARRCSTSRVSSTLRDVKAGSASRTAMGAALGRAAHREQDPPPWILDDPIACELLPEGVLARIASARPRSTPALSAAIRTVFPVRARPAPKRVPKARGCPSAGWPNVSPDSCVNAVSRWTTAPLSPKRSSRSPATTIVSRRCGRSSRPSIVHSIRTTQSKRRQRSPEVRLHGRKTKFLLQPGHHRLSPEGVKRHRTSAEVAHAGHQARRRSGTPRSRRPLPWRVAIGPRTPSRCRAAGRARQRVL